MSIFEEYGAFQLNTVIILFQVWWLHAKISEKIHLQWLILSSIGINVLSNEIGGRKLKEKDSEFIHNLFFIINWISVYTNCFRILIWQEEMLLTSLIQNGWNINK